MDADREAAQAGWLTCTQHRDKNDNQAGGEGKMGKLLKCVGGGAAWALTSLPVSAAEVERVSRGHPVESVGGLLALACLAVLVIAFTILFVSVWHHRRTGRPDTKHFHRSTAVEMAWTSVPVLILALAAYPAAMSSLGDGTSSAHQRTVENTQRLAAADRAGDLPGIDAFVADKQ